MRLEYLLEGPALRGLAAAAEASFPPSGTGAPDWRGAAVVERARVWLGELPPTQRLLILLLFTAIELGAPVLAPGLRTFSRRPPAARAAALLRWSRTAFYPVRLLGEASKAVLGMMYFSHPAVLAHIGMYSPCERPADPLAVEVRADALRASAARAAARAREAVTP